MEAIIEQFSQHSRKLATLVTVLAVVLMSLSVARTVLFVVENSNEKIVAKPVSTSPERTRTTAPVNLPALNLFGVSDATAPRQVEAPQTNLNLELQGVFMAEDPDESTAIIAERNKSGELYQIGDRLPGNVVLDAVFDDYILIKRGGRVEKLMFPDASIKQQFSASNQVPTIPSPTPMPSRLQNLRERIEARRNNSVAPTGSEQASNSADVRAYLSDYRTRLEQDRSAALSEIGLAPVTEGDDSGYRIGGEAPEQYLNQAGLQRGDVVLSVNGTPVGNASNDRALIDQALSTGRARVEIQRGERKFFLTVPIP